MIESELCRAISLHRTVEFYYRGTDRPGTRTVEPHMIASNDLNHLALSAWFLHGRSASQEGPGWREYLLSDISNVVVLNETFIGTRPGYQPTGGKTFHNVRCAL